MSAFDKAPIYAALVAAGVLIAGAPGAFAQQKVGINAAVNPDVSGTPPGGTVRRLMIGQDVVFNEHITTSPAGQTQILFVDESAMTIGPNSDVTIDQFVFDPNTGSGKMAATAARGVLRYVGGKLSKQENAVSVRTPAGTIAVRGGTMLTTVGVDGSLEVIFVYGTELIVTGTTGAVQALRRPGFAILVAGPGATPSPPFAAPPGRIPQLLAALDGRRGGSGGANRVPSDATVASSGVSATISDDYAASVKAAAGTRQTGSLPDPPNPATLQTSYNVNTVQAQGAVDSSLNPATVVQTFANQQIQGGTTFPDNNLFLANNGISQSLGMPTLTLSNGTMTVAAAGQSATFPAPTGTTANFSGATSTFGSINGTTFVSPTTDAYYAFVTAPNYPGQAAFVFGGIPATNLPASGVGTYHGTATGSVNNAGTSYTATGQFTNQYNFGTRTGGVTLQNFDSRTLSGTAVAGANNTYGGNFGGIAGTPSANLAGNFNGRFYGVGAPSTAGNFSIVNTSGAAYNATGVFGGSR